MVSVVGKMHSEFIKMFVGRSFRLSLAKGLSTGLYGYRNFSFNEKQCDSSVPGHHHYNSFLYYKLVWLFLFNVTIASKTLMSCFSQTFGITIIFIYVLSE